MQNTRIMTRQELYDLVWSKPMCRLCEDFGLSDRGLAKICERHAIPTPPRGYWAKREAGRRVRQTPLPDAKASPLDRIRIDPPPPTSESELAAESAAKEREGEIGPIEIPETMRGLHPIVVKWVEAHTEDQAKRRQERRANRDRWYWPDTRADLTDRDKYRFRVTSAFLKAVEKAGGVAASGEIRGKLKLTVCGETVECVIAEKLKRKLLTEPSNKEWTAWPEHHNSGLSSSGFLRLTIDCWRINRQDFIESNRAKADVLLPKLIAAVLAAGPRLIQCRKEDEEREARWRREAEERAERERLTKEDEERWQRFRKFAMDWEEAARLRRFIETLKPALASAQSEVDGRTTSQWIEWAEEKARLLDPLTNSPDAIFSLPKQSYRYGY